MNIKKSDVNHKIKKNAMKRIYIFLTSIFMLSADNEINNIKFIQCYFLSDVFF